MTDKKLVFIDIDGILPEVLYELLDDKTTNLHRIGGRGLRVERAVTIFPAVTLCCQASMYTGVWPNEHYILGNSWFDRHTTPTQFRYYTDAKTAAGTYGFGLVGWPTIVLPQRPDLMYANNDMNQDVKTIYQMAGAAGLSSWQVLNQYSRGVDRWIRPSRPAMITFALCHEEKIHNRWWDRANFKHFSNALKKTPPPNLLVFYESGLDNHSHQHGADTQLAYMRDVVDPLFGNFIADLEKHAPLEQYYFLITSDHSQAKVIREKEYIIDHAIVGEILSAAPGGGFQLAARKKVTSTDTAIACMEAGATQFHFINRKTFDWRDAPRFEEDVLAAADALAPYKTGRLPFVDKILVRRDIEEGYLVYEDGELIDLDTFFADKDDEYPDAAERLRGINGPRSGDLILLLDYAPGYYFGDKVKAGEHGNLCAADAYIPLVVSGPGIHEQTIPRASLLDAVPTVGAILGFDTTGARGKSLIDTPPDD